MNRLDEEDLEKLLGAGAEVVLRVLDGSGHRVVEFEAHLEGPTLVMTQRRVVLEPIGAAGLGAQQLRRLAQRAIGERSRVEIEARAWSPSD